MAIRQLTFNYNANGGSGAPSSSTDSFNVNSVPYTKTKKIASAKPSRTYYNFLGWGPSAGSTSATWASSQTLSFTWASLEQGNVTMNFYAVWQHQTAYVNYNANGGSGAPSTQSHWAGYSVTLSATKPTRAKYIFLGWSQSSTATTASYQPNTSYALYNTVTLYAVWKKASDTVSAPNGTIGSAIALTITKIDNSYTDDITYSFGSVTGTIASGTTATTLSWTPPLSLASEIPNASSATCTFTCTTYSNGTLIGTTTKTITLTVPQSLAPTVSVSYADTIAQCLTWGLLVQSRSKLAFTITASGQQGATIASYSTSVNGTSYNSASFTTDVLLYNGTNSYTVTVTDSRGLQTVSTGNFSVVAYSNPSLTLTLCDRNDSDPDQVDIGFDFSVASVSSNNDANYRLDYKLKSASTWTNGTVQSLGAYSGSISDLIANLDGGDEWDIRINVIDSFQTASVESEVGVAGNILLNSRHNGGLGLLMKSQADNQLDIGKPTVHHGAVLEQFGSTVQTHSASGNYAQVVSFELLGSHLTAPITVEFIRTGDARPTKVTFCFGSGGTLTSFNSNNVTDVYLHYASSVWTLYIGKSSASDKVEILDVHNSWSNSDISVEWDDDSISTLPTGTVQAEAVNTNIEVNANAVSVASATWTNTGSITLTKGTWIITAFAQFATNTTGRRQALISETSASSTSVRGMMTDNQAPVNGAVTICRFMDIYTVTADSKTLYLNSYQNSGSAMNVYGRIYALKII